MATHSLRLAYFLIGSGLIAFGAVSALRFSSIAPRGAQADDKGGFAVRLFVNTDGSRHKYIEFVPYALRASDRPPVILFLNGYRENGEDGLMQLSNNFGLPVWEMKRRFPFVIVAPQCPSDQSWEAHGAAFEQALRILDTVVEKVHADPDRIFLVGVSTGSVPIWSMAADYPDRFAALVPTASSGCLGKPANIADAIVRAGIPVWADYNRFDNMKGVVAFNRQMKIDLLKAGASPHYTEHPSKEHDCWNRVYRSPALYSWLLKQHRGKTSTANRFKLFDPPQLLQEFTTGRDHPWVATTEGTIRASLDEKTDSVILSRKSFRDFECHVECKIEAGAACGIIVAESGSSSGPRRGWKLLLCSPLSGSGGLVSLDGTTWLAGMAPLAQRSLDVKEWNDVRIRVQGDSLIVDVNGWRALDVHDARLDEGRRQIGLLQERGASKASEWRWLRIRELPGADEHLRKET
jgi:pimeloyl-ACP methyl ester carboxylesterase